MSASIWPPSRLRWLFKLCITVLLVALAQPANAFYTRGCNAEHVITTSSFDGNTVRRSFRGEGVHPFGPNRARRHAHRIIRQCVNDHRQERESSSGSILCDEDSRIFGYPFNNLMAEVTEAVCEANPNRPLIDVNLPVLYTGDTGCTGPVWFHHPFAGRWIDHLWNARLHTASRRRRSDPTRRRGARVRL